MVSAINEKKKKRKEKKTLFDTKKFSIRTIEKQGKNVHKQADRQTENRQLQIGRQTNRDLKRGGTTERKTLCYKSSIVGFIFM